MAENLQLLKKRIKTSQNIAQIAKAMEMIAASKIKRAQTAVENNRPYARRITETVEHIMANVDLSDIDHPFVRPVNAAPLVIVMAPDKGLCGGLPGNLLRKLMSVISADTQLLAIGKKAERLSLKLNNPLVASFSMGTTFPGYAGIYPILAVVNRLRAEGSIGAVSVLYTEFKSMLMQSPVCMPLLPVTAPGTARQDDVPYLFEPSPAAVLRDLLPRYVEAKLYTAMIQAFTSEQAARMVAMKNAKDNATDISFHLTNRYNRSRQERITNEILDLANGAA